jgi:hypothetical protein
VAARQIDNNLVKMKKVITDLYIGDDKRVLALCICCVKRRGGVPRDIRPALPYQM